MVGARVYFRGFFEIISSEFSHKDVLDFNMLFLVGLWGLVNNAGIAYVMPVEWTPMSIFKRTADVNLWGMIEMTKTFLPLVKRDQGRVVNIGSMAGKGNKLWLLS